MWNSLTVRLRLIIVAVIMATALAVRSADCDDRILAKTSDELPRHTYAIGGTVAGVIRSADRFRLFAAPVRDDIEADLAKYHIEDRATLQRLHGVLLNFHMLDHDFDAALARLDLIRSLEDKEAARLLSGQSIRAFIAARREAGDDDVRFRAAFSRNLLEGLRALPWEIVGDRIRWALRDAETMTENVLFGIVESRFEPVAAESGSVSAHLARQFVTARHMLEFEIPLRGERIAVYKILIDENRAPKKDIWTGRQISLSEEQALDPVLVAVWDTGLDRELFPGRLYVNRAEKPDGTDTDGNGFVDDIHGIAFDGEGRPTSGLLHPLDDLHDSLARVTELSRGSKDIAAGVDSRAAAAYRRFLETLSPDDYAAFGDDQVLLGVYQHGTHVTGITAEGNPFIRILTVRFTGEHRSIPTAPTVERARREADAMGATVAYFKKQGVRVVNMSWLNNRSLVESALEANGVGPTAAERSALAREIYGIERNALHASIVGAPDILFVTAAGNFDNDVDFSEAYPAGFDLPNLLVVGAVDRSGAPTSFTSFGKTVQVYANGFEVEGVVPGGGRKKMSGTSMSSPAATNLAAKLLALEPSLSPAETIELIIQGSERIEDAGPMLLINPKRTVALLKNHTVRQRPLETNGDQN